MEAIAKKMQAMKVEKDNAMDDSDIWEQKARAMKVFFLISNFSSSHKLLLQLRQDKAEEELDTLIKQAQQLEMAVDKVKEDLGLMEEKLAEKETALNNGEVELAALDRHVQEIENSLEDCDDMMLAAVNKLDKAQTAFDDTERLRKVMENKAQQDEERMTMLEEELKVMRKRCDDADSKFDGVQKKMLQTEANLERAEVQGDLGEHKIIEMEEELQVVANNLRSLEVSEEKANEREKCDKALVTTLTAKLKQAESRAQFAEKSVQKLQNEVSFLLLDAAAVTEFFRWTSWTIVSWKNN